MHVLKNSNLNGIICCNHLSCTQNPNIRTSVDYIIMETKLDDFFIKSLNKKVDELLLDANRVSQSEN